MAFAPVLVTVTGFASAAPNGLSFAKSTSTGAPTKMEEYVPVTTPINIANAKPRVTSPPNINKARIVKNTVNDVMIVRLSVSLIARLMIVALFAPFISREYSLILSNTITVSFMEKPITVNIAAIKCWSISSGNGTMFLKKENTIRVTNTSCNKVMMVPAEYLQSLNRTKIYRKIASNAKIVALIAPRFRSSDILGSTVVLL